MLVVALLVLTFPASASAREMWVDPGHGSDRAPGTRTQPLRSVDEAWSRISARRTLGAPVTVQLRAGTYPVAAFPEYFESRWGSGARNRITLRSVDGRGRAVLPSMNLYDVRGLTLDGATLRSTGDVFHCERCVGVNILRSRLLGSRRAPTRTSRPTSRATCASRTR